MIDNVKKRSNDFQYVWVVERQTKNNEFKGNPHFHMITNKFWKIEMWWNYWLTLQQKNGITPREKDFKPSSAFDVKQLNTNNIRRITSYVTKYVTKNNAKFNCQVWNCSKKVSQLYTDFYTKEEFTDQFKRLGAVLKEFKDRDPKNPVINIKVIDLNRNTLPLYKRLDNKNKERNRNHKSIRCLFSFQNSPKSIFIFSNLCLVSICQESGKLLFITLLRS